MYDTSAPLDISGISNAPYLLRCMVNSTSKVSLEELSTDTENLAELALCELVDAIFLYGLHYTNNYGTTSPEFLMKEESVNRLKSAISRLASAPEGWISGGLYKSLKDWEFNSSNFEVGLLYKNLRMAVRRASSDDVIPDAKLLAISTMFDSSILKSVDFGKAVDIYIPDAFNRGNANIKKITITGFNFNTTYRNLPPYWRLIGCATFENYDSIFNTLAMTAMPIAPCKYSSVSSDNHKDYAYSHQTLGMTKVSVANLAASIAIARMLDLYIDNNNSKMAVDAHMWREVSRLHRRNYNYNDRSENYNLLTGSISRCSNVKPISINASPFEGLVISNEAVDPGIVSAADKALDPDKVLEEGDNDTKDDNSNNVNDVEDDNESTLDTDDDNDDTIAPPGGSTGEGPSVPEPPNNDMMPIRFRTGNETADNTLYRCAVQKLCAELARRPGLISTDRLDILKLWCEEWIFIAKVDTTKALVKWLGLESALQTQRKDV